MIGNGWSNAWEALIMLCSHAAIDPQCLPFTSIFKLMRWYKWFRHYICMYVSVVFFFFHTVYLSSKLIRTSKNKSKTIDYWRIYPDRDWLHSDAIKAKAACWIYIYIYLGESWVINKYDKRTAVVRKLSQPTDKGEERDDET